MAEMPTDNGEFIESIANLRPSDPVPDGGLRAVVGRLVALGVMEEPSPETAIGDVIDDMRAAAQRYR